MSGRFDHDAADDLTDFTPTIIANPQPLYCGYPPDFAPRLITLFERIQARGSEPLFPSTWQLDFLGLPDSLFLSEFSDSSYAAVRSMSSDHSSEFRGKLAIERMLLVGRAVRDRIELNTLGRTDSERLPVETLIKQEIKRFIQWTCADAEIELNCFDLFIVLCTRSRTTGRDACEDYDQLTGRMTRKLTRLAQLHRDAVNKLVAQERRTSIHSRDKVVQALEELGNYRIERARGTTVYGICVCGALLVVVALNTRSADSPIRTLLTIDYTDASQDLWNTLAVVLTVMSAKEECLDCVHMSEIREEQELASTFSNMNVTPASLDDIDA